MLKQKLFSNVSTINKAYLLRSENSDLYIRGVCLFRDVTILNTSCSGFFKASIYSDPLKLYYFFCFVKHPYTTLCSKSKTSSKNTYALIFSHILYYYKFPVLLFRAFYYIYRPYKSQYLSLIHI